MLPTTTQMKSCDKLDEIKDLEIKHIEKQLELVNQWKLIGFTIDQDLGCRLEIPY